MTETPDLMASLRVSLEAHRAEQRARDNEPCPKCGGDRLRTDFTDAPRCHAALGNGSEGSND